jgi:hypothetical protein
MHGVWIATCFDKRKMEQGISLTQKSTDEIKTMVHSLPFFTKLLKPKETHFDDVVELILERNPWHKQQLLEEAKKYRGATPLEERLEHALARACFRRSMNATGPLDTVVTEICIFCQPWALNTISDLRKKKTVTAYVRVNETTDCPLLKTVVLTNNTRMIILIVDEISQQWKEAIHIIKKDWTLILFPRHSPHQLPKFPEKCRLLVLSETTQLEKIFL